MNLTDETRRFLASKLPRCPACGCAAMMVRDVAADLTQTGVKTRFMIGCERVFGHSRCPVDHCKFHTTPWLPSAEDAVRHWTLAIKLAQ